MTDLELFERILTELGSLWLRLGDLSEHVMLIGGQVIALEQACHAVDTGSRPA